ncbi:pentatricopeptide repeat-containing protein At2g15630, mitochondrial-like [Lotus japonicus]|uniref:pentatricopeptide repeat-containing protein At2g15630, mitochondrial-like n=1 Tax=Lotus japonicus TaxID=34305 RepID=UPI0025854BD2|nr:pentatricopeptide repeat-containing protein At2g15630, mitochondrial-like [Lotus japonicus]
MKEAFRVRDEMLKVGFDPTITTYKALVLGCCTHHEVEQAKELLKEMKRASDMSDSGLVRYAYSDNSYNFVMYKEGGLEEASDLLPEMLELESGLVPHTLIYDTLIDECCTKGIGTKGSLDEIDKAVAYKDEMISRGIEPTIVTYTLLIVALFEVGRSWGAEDMIKEMQEKGLKLDVYTYNTLMSGYAKCKYIDAHIGIYDEMVEKRIQPNLLAYNTMMLGHCRCSEAQKLFDKMKTSGIKPDHLSYNLLIAGYSYRGGYVKEAFRVRDEMLKNGIDPTFTTYDALILGLRINHEVEQAEELLKEMVSKGICTPDDKKYLILTDMVHRER